MKRSWWLAGLAVAILIGGYQYFHSYFHSSSGNGRVETIGGLSVSAFGARSDGAVQLTSTRGRVSNQNPCVVEAGRAIVFTRFANGYNRGPSALIRHELATGAETVIVNDGEHDHVNTPGACWDQITSRVLFASDRASEFEEIFTVKLDGSKLRRITTHTEPRSYLEPTFSPDGTQIAFESAPSLKNREEEAQPAQIVTIDDDGSPQRTLMSPAPSFEIDDRLPSWSRDGRLLFQRRQLVKVREEVSESIKNVEWRPWDVWVVEPVGAGWSEPRNVSGVIAPDSNETDASWFPNGQWIVASSDFGGLIHPSLFAFSLNGGPPVRITTDSDHEDGAPSLSPDGRWVVFESHRTADETSPTDLWLIKLPAQLR